MQPARHVTRDIYVIPSEYPAPGIGVLPVNAYLIKASEPVLVDAGLEMDRGAFMNALEAIVDPEDIRWLYLTHPDRDHLGSLTDVLERAPRARLVTTYLGYGTLGLSIQVPMERVYFLNPGESLSVGDRTLTALRPPTFDSPSTTGFWDNKARTLFSADCFGAVLPECPAEASDLDADILRSGQVLWTTVDSPWLHKIDRRMLAAELNKVRQLEPEFVCSGHLPPARRMTGWMVESLAAAPDADEFVGPDQAALETMMAEMARMSA